MLYPLPSNAVFRSYFPSQKCEIGFSAGLLVILHSELICHGFVAVCQELRECVKTLYRIAALFWQWLCLLSILINVNCCGETNCFMPLESFSGKPESSLCGLDVLLSFSFHQVEWKHLNETFVGAPSYTVALISCCDASLWNPYFATLANLSVIPLRTEIMGQTPQRVSVYCMWRTW